MRFTLCLILFLSFNLMAVTTSGSKVTNKLHQAVTSQVTTVSNAIHTVSKADMNARTNAVMNTLRLSTNAATMVATNVVMNYVRTASNAGRAGITAEMTFLTNWFHGVFNSQMSNRFVAYSNAHP